MKLNTRIIDPVCRKALGSGDLRIFASVGKEMYYFCTENCRERFVNSPDKYTASKKTKKKGLWQQYLDRINRATGGKPPCCH